MTRRFTTYPALSVAPAIAVRLIALSTWHSAHLDSNNAQGPHAPVPPDGRTNDERRTPLLVKGQAGPGMASPGPASLG